MQKRERERENRKWNEKCVHNSRFVSTMEQRGKKKWNKDCKKIRYHYILNKTFSAACAVPLKQWKKRHWIQQHSRSQKKMFILFYFFPSCFSSMEPGTLSLSLSVHTFWMPDILYFATVLVVFGSCCFSFKSYMFSFSTQFHCTVLRRKFIDNKTENTIIAWGISI